MEFDPTTIERRQVYALMDNCIVPRPIAWVSTQDNEGINNLAPFSFFNGISSNPPALYFSVGYNRNRPNGTKDTLSNVLELKEFVVNVVTQDIASAMVETSIDHPSDVDEFVVAKLTPTPSLTVRPPRIAESPVCFECVLYNTMQIGEGPGSSTMVVGIIKHMFVHDSVLTAEGNIDTQQLHIVGRSANNQYCHLRDSFDISRPS